MVILLPLACMVSFAKFVTLQEAEAMGADIVAQAHATADASDVEQYTGKFRIGAAHQDQPFEK